MHSPMVDVMVVGMGPVGAALSALLVQKGLTVLAVEREPAIYPLPRAVGFDHEIMRIFQHLGIHEEVSQHVRASPSYDFVNGSNQLLLRYDRSSGTSLSGWPQNVAFYQPGVELALRRVVEHSADGTIILGSQLTAIEQDDASVVATLSGPGGITSTARARYLVGCDGAASTVRKLLGARLDDYGFDEPWLVVDLIGEDESDLPPCNTQICDPARPATFMRMGPGRHRWEFMLLDGENAADMLQDETIRNLIAERGHRLNARIERKAVYRFHALVADAWQKGRVFLAGDAAHQTPPFAGQGMCSGLRDAFNLAWKFEAVMKNGAPTDLLATYQPEREGNVRFIIDSAIGLGRVVCTTDPNVAAERDARMMADLRMGKQPISMTYPPFEKGCIAPGTAGAGTLFPQPWASTPSGILRFDDLFRGQALLLVREEAAATFHVPGLRRIALESKVAVPFAAPLLEWLDRHAARSVLVRPDFYVFGTGNPDELARLWAKKTSFRADAGAVA